MNPEINPKINPEADTSNTESNTNNDFFSYKELAKKYKHQALTESIESVFNQPSQEVMNAVNSAANESDSSPSEWGRWYNDKVTAGGILIQIDDGEPFNLLEHGNRYVEGKFAGITGDEHKAALQKDIAGGKMFLLNSKGEMANKEEKQKNLQEFIKIILCGNQDSDDEYANTAAKFISKYVRIGGIGNIVSSCVKQDCLRTGQSITAIDFDIEHLRDRTKPDRASKFILKYSTHNHALTVTETTTLIEKKGVKSVGEIALSAEYTIPLRSGDDLENAVARVPAALNVQVLSASGTLAGKYDNRSLGRIFLDWWKAVFSKVQRSPVVSPITTRPTTPSEVPGEDNKTIPRAV